MEIRGNKLLKFPTNAILFPKGAINMTDIRYISTKGSPPGLWDYQQEE